MASEIEFASSDFPPSHKTASYAGYTSNANSLSNSSIVIATALFSNGNINNNIKIFYEKMLETMPKCYNSTEWRVNKSFGERVSAIDSVVILRLLCLLTLEL